MFPGNLRQSPAILGKMFHVEHFATGRRAAFYFSIPLNLLIPMVDRLKE